MSRPGTIAIGLTLVLLAAGPALADDTLIPQPEQTVRGTPPELGSPLRLRSVEGKGGPLWTHAGLWPSRPRSLPALARAARTGPPTYDPHGRALFAAASGTIVELRANGSLRVTFEGVQGLDVDVRAGKGLAVSREPDQGIVLHRAGAGAAQRRLLLEGDRFFGPRFSPAGDQILVSESRAEGGHIWLLALDGTATDLGQGYSPAWHPDGKRIIFCRISHDGYRLTDGDLWELDLASRRERCLARTPGLIEVEPAISPDGRWLAFQDGRGGDLYLARYPGAAARR
jgi:hypothetical protein